MTLSFISATDLAIAAASRRGTLSLTERPSRFGDTYVAISDEHGLIEVALTMAEAQERVWTITGKYRGHTIARLGNGRFWAPFSMYAEDFQTFDEARSFIDRVSACQR